MNTTTTQAQTASQHEPFDLQLDQDGIAMLSVSHHWLNEHDFDTFRTLLGRVLYQKAKGVIILSNQPDCFIQGLNVDRLQEKTDVELLAYSQSLQALMRELNQLPVPVVAAINGRCFGFGLELALACDFRLATLNPATRFAMPQVRSGLIPFAGGTQRLVRLVGLKNAVPLLISGHKITLEKALNIGLVDQAVPEALLISRARQLILENGVRKAQWATAKQPWLTRVKQGVLANAWLRNWYLDRLESRSWLKTFGNYPAVDTIFQLLREPHFKVGLQQEQEAFARLAKSEHSRVLIHLKKTARQMKKLYQHRGNVRDIAQVSVLGSGFMGAGIAYITAHNAKIPVRIKEIHSSELQHALQTCYHLMQKDVDQKRMKRGEMLQQMNLISGGERLLGAQSTDFVIEAVYEDLALKQQMVRESEQFYSPHTIFATNTSTFAIREIAAAATRPENVIGVHYFSPVVTRKLVEIVPHAGTSEQTIATAIHFVIQQGKTPLLVADREGFFINRLVTPFVLEGLECLLEGEAIEFIDRALHEFGFTLGPLEIIDEMGLDMLARAETAMVRELGSRFKLPAKTAFLLDNDRKGRKNGRGFYLYDKYGTRTMEDKSIYHVLEVAAENDLEAEEIARRCVLRMINEAAWCWQEGVISSMEEGNVASVLGAHFPEFRGGIYAYIEQIGAKTIVRELKRHATRYGARFTPCDWLLQKANEA